MEFKKRGVKKGSHLCLVRKPAGDPCLGLGRRLRLGEGEDGHGQVHEPVLELLEGFLLRHLYFYFIFFWGGGRASV